MTAATVLTLGRLAGSVGLLVLGAACLWAARTLLRSNASTGALFLTPAGVASLVAGTAGVLLYHGIAVTWASWVLALAIIPVDVLLLVYVVRHAMAGRARAHELQVAIDHIDKGGDCE